MKERLFILIASLALAVPTAAQDAVPLSRTNRSITVYGFMWPKLSGAEGMHGVSTTGGH